MQINLVATEMVVEQEHANRLTFTPGAGLDHRHLTLAPSSELYSWLTSSSLG